MPAVSGKQYRLMQAVAHNPAVAKRTGISRKLALEYIKKTSSKKRSEWSRITEAIKRKRKKKGKKK